MGKKIRLSVNTTDLRGDIAERLRLENPDIDIGESIGRAEAAIRSMEPQGNNAIYQSIVQYGAELAKQAIIPRYESRRIELIRQQTSETIGAFVIPNGKIGEEIREALTPEYSVPVGQRG